MIYSAIGIMSGSSLDGLDIVHTELLESGGKWHYEMITLNWTKRFAVKTLYGGLPDADIDKAIEYFEKCKSAEPYFMLNYLYLAKAYKEKNRPAQAIEVLDKLVKLPIRTIDDSAIKAEGQKLLQDLQ